MRKPTALLLWKRAKRFFRSPSQWEEASGTWCARNRVSSAGCALSTWRLAVRPRTRLRKKKPARRVGPPALRTVASLSALLASRPILPPAPHADFDAEGRQRRHRHERRLVGGDAQHRLERHLAR